MQDAPLEPRARAVAEMERDENEYDGGGERRAREGGQLCVRARYQRDAACTARAEGESSGRDAEIERAEAAGGLGGGWGEGGGGGECGGEG